jgi:alpha/beta superfamily hydrolase
MAGAAQRAPREVVRERLRIPCQGETLDAELAYPAEGEPETAVLWLAPHPHLGGRMDNNVVRHLAARAAEDGAAVLRFDYRGVGESTLVLPAGTSRYAHWEAMESARSYEQLLPDALAACAALLGAVGRVRRRVAAGYSLGAILAGMVSVEAGATHVLCISPPVVKVGLAALSGCPLPKLFVGGDDDFAFDAARLRQELAALPGPREFVPIPGADHFFRKEEERLYRTVAPFLLGGQP